MNVFSVWCKHHLSELIELWEHYFVTTGRHYVPLESSMPEQPAVALIKRARRKD